MHSFLYRVALVFSFILFFFAGISNWVLIPSYADLGREVELVFRVLSGLICLLPILLFFESLRAENWREVVSKLSPIVLVVFLSFPFLFKFLYPIISTHGAWLHIQHQNLSWLGGDIYTTQEYSGFGKKNRLFVIDSPGEVSASAVPKLEPDFFSLGTVQEIVVWLGYGDSFLQFAGKGFFLAVGGVLLLSILSFREANNFSFSLFSKWLRRLVCSLGSFFFISLSFSLVSGSFVHQAEQKIMGGFYPEARASLLKSTIFMPALKHSSSWIVQMGLLDNKLGIESGERDVFLAKIKLESGKKSQAVSLAIKHTKSESLSGLNREARRILLRTAIDAYNSGRIVEATATVQEILASDNTSLKANYLAQLITLRSRDYESLEKLVEQQKSIYRFFNSKSKKPVLASGDENLALAKLEQGELEESLRLWKDRGR